MPSWYEVGEYDRLAHLINSIRAIPVNGGMAGHTRDSCSFNCRSALEIVYIFCERNREADAKEYYKGYKEMKEALEEASVNHKFDEARDKMRTIFFTKLERFF